MWSSAKSLGRTKIRNIADLKEYFKTKPSSPVTFSIIRYETSSSTFRTEDTKNIGTITLTKDDVTAAANTVDNFNQRKADQNRDIDGAAKTLETAEDTVAAQKAVNDASTVLPPPKLFENIFKQSNNSNKTVTIPNAKLMGVKNITDLYFMDEGGVMDEGGSVKTKAFKLVYHKKPEKPEEPEEPKPDDFIKWKIYLQPRILGTSFLGGGTKYRRRTPRKSRKTRKSKKRR
jgi:hypothetical protein